MIWNRDAETMPRERLRALQLRRLQDTVRRACERVPLYRRRFDEAGVGPDDLRSLDDLSRLPFTRKTDLRETYPYGMFAVPREEVVRIHASSGTRGKPTVVGYTRADLATWSEAVARCLAGAGVRPGDVLHVAYGYGLFTGGLGFHQGGELMGCTVIPMSGGNTARQILMMQDLGSQALCCTPSYALNIADVMDELGVDPGGLDVRVGIFGAEPWTEEMRAEIERRLKLEAVDMYGLSEVIGPGVSCECVEAKAGGHLQEDLFLAEVVDPASGDPLPPGQEGELVFTSLTKEALPVIRYRTGDISALEVEPCTCGRTTARLRRVRGRYDDMLIIRGVNLYPSEVERVLLGFRELAPHYQLIVDRVQALDALEVQAEVGDAVARGLGPWTGEDGPLPAGLHDLRARLERELQQECGLSIAVRLLPPRGVPRSEGKAVRVIDKRSG